MSDLATTEQDGDCLSSPSGAFTGWFASSTLQFGMVLIGVFLQLATLGQLSGSASLHVEEDR